MAKWQAWALRINLCVRNQTEMLQRKLCAQQGPQMLEEMLRLQSPPPRNLVRYLPHQPAQMRLQLVSRQLKQ
jgi:hypothetical protein